MAKFFVVYRVPVETMQEWRKNTKPEEMKAQGEKLGVLKVRIEEVLGTSLSSSKPTQTI